MHKMLVIECDIPKGVNLDDQVLVDEVRDILTRKTRLQNITVEVHLDASETADQSGNNSEG